MKPGDTVALRGGVFTMTVTRIREHTEPEACTEVFCLWHDAKGKLRSASFPAEVLIKVGA